MPQDATGQLARCVAGRGTGCARVPVSGERRLHGGLRGAVAAADAVAARRHRAHRRRQAGDGLRRHGGDHGPRRPARPGRAGVGRVRRQRDGGAGRAGWRAGPGGRASASSSATCRRGTMPNSPGCSRTPGWPPPTSCWPGAARSRHPPRSSCSGGCPGSRTRRSAPACASVAAGSSEMDLAAALTRSVYAQGAQQFKLMIVATGERSQLPNVDPSERILRPGDVCRVEIFSVIDGYHAGVCRTAIVGDPTPEASYVYRNLADCKKILLDAIAARRARRPPSTSASATSSTSWGWRRSRSSAMASASTCTRRPT